MDRRSFLKAGTAAAGITLAPQAFASSHLAMRVYISPSGSDRGQGTEKSPFRTVGAALRKVDHASSATILLLPGTYYLDETLFITPESFAGKCLSLRSTETQKAILSGGQRLDLHWQPDQGQVWKAQVPPGTTTDQLFINGTRQVLARYPNFDKNARYLDGSTTMHAIQERARLWQNPTSAYVHALQQSHWGSLHYRVSGRASDGTLELDGGWQINRSQPLDPNHVFVENVREELDSPGEWFLDTDTATLYYWPLPGLDLTAATVEIASFESILQVRSNTEALLQNISVEGVVFRHTRRTFMQTRETVVRSDWMIYRSGAVLLSGTKDCSITNCFFDQLGGNAVFLDGRNENTCLTRVRISQSGASGICVMGRTESVRSPVSTADGVNTLSSVDRTPGPLTNAHPSNVLIQDCLIQRTGRIEKQSAGIVIDIAQRTLVEYCTIYGVPRAGINIGDGAWGGHRIRNCDVFDTVLETSDHGAFNSWGRDRWWHLQGANADTLVGAPLADIPTLDALEPTVLEHSRWACAHGWDIDLDDGSSNYVIRENLCMNGGIKLREGFYRQCIGNLMVNNTLHPHVWPLDSEDVVEKNIVFAPYQPVRISKWGKKIDYNFLHLPTQPIQAATALQTLSGMDQHSLQGDAMLQSFAMEDFTVKPASAALTLGFKNIPVRFGVRTPYLRALAETIDTAGLLKTQPSTLELRPAAELQLFGAKLRNLRGAADVSALGASSTAGALIVELQIDSPWSKAGMRENDLLLRWNGEAIPDTSGLAKLVETTSALTEVSVTMLRNQRAFQCTFGQP